MGGVNEHGPCDRCERWIDADSLSDSLCAACNEAAAGEVPFDGGQAVFTPEEWTEIVLDAEFERYLDSARDDGTGGQA
jgi:hypothetical protein